MTQEGWIFIIALVVFCAIGGWFIIRSMGRQDDDHEQLLKEIPSASRPRCDEIAADKIRQRDPKLADRLAQRWAELNGES